MRSELWQSVALGEEAAVYAYGVLAPRLAGPERDRAVNAHAAHSRARDNAVAEWEAAGGQAVLPGAFQLPFDVSDAESARQLAATVEDRLVNIYCTLAPELTGRQRRAFVESAREGSARAVGWGQRPEALPGTGSPDMSPIPDRKRSDPTGSGAPTQAPGAPSGDGATLAP